MPEIKQKFLGRITIEQRGKSEEYQKGKYRSLMSIFENNGSVYFSLPTVAFYNDETSTTPHYVEPKPEEIVKTRKVSIHPSIDNPYTNTFHETIEFIQGKKCHFYQQTSAIKLDNQFAFAFGRRCPVMIDRPSDLSGKKPDDTCLGYYNSDYFTLYYALFVGRKDRIFYPSSFPGDFNIHQFRVADFNFVLVWSFLSVPAYDVACPLQISSYSELNNDGEYTHTPTIGMNESQCIEAFRQSRLITTADLMLALGSDDRASAADRDNIRHNSVFYRYGRSKNDFYFVNSPIYHRTELNFPLLHFQKAQREIKKE